MNKLKIPENHSGVSKTLRLPENIVEDIQNLANIKNLSFNKIVISLLEFSLNNLDDSDRKKIDKLQNKMLIGVCVYLFILLLLLYRCLNKVLIFLLCK